MYPKQFTFDPTHIERARIVTLRSPNLNILRDENRAEMPGIAHFLEQGFKARNADGKLLLPDLRALYNRTVGVFSDYGGEDSGSKFYTYSFLVCAFGSLDPFHLEMAKLRKKFKLGNKEIAYKDFGFGPLRRMLSAYVKLCDSHISGLLFTLVVDKTIPSLFGPGDAETVRRRAEALAQCGNGSIAAHVGEKLLRVVHCVAFLMALLGHNKQNLFWMTDHDPIVPTPKHHDKLLEVFSKVLPLYTDKQITTLGGALPFSPRELKYLDLLSIPDIAAGTLAQTLTGIDTVGLANTRIKNGADDVLRWLCHNSITLKKFVMTVKRLPNGEVGCGPVDFEARFPVPGELFVPAQLIR